VVFTNISSSSRRSADHRLHHSIDADATILDTTGAQGGYSGTRLRPNSKAFGNVRALKSRSVREQVSPQPNPVAGAYAEGGLAVIGKTSSSSGSATGADARSTSR
jgi:hypothetical protein